jgi:hypothetical protein
MTPLKCLGLAAALFLGATSLAMAQAQGSGGPDGQLTTSAGAADNPPTPGRTSGKSTRTRHHGTTHQMYMSARGAGMHKKNLKTGTNGGY